MRQYESPVTGASFGSFWRAANHALHLGADVQLCLELQLPASSPQTPTEDREPFTTCLHVQIIDCWIRGLHQHSSSSILPTPKGSSTSQTSAILSAGDLPAMSILLNESPSVGTARHQVHPQFKSMYFQSYFAMEIEGCNFVHFSYCCLGSR